MINFGIKDIIDILIVALMLFYLYRLMKSSGTLSLFYGVLAFILIWVVSFEIFDMRLTGTIVDKFMSIGLIVLVILFQDQIKRFLIDIGERGNWLRIRGIFKHKKDDGRTHAEVMNVVYACMSMSKSKTGALIVFQRKMPLSDYEKTGDEIDADINVRLIENIFFKNSPLHDGGNDHRQPPHRLRWLHSAGEPRHEHPQESGIAPPRGAWNESGNRLGLRDRQRGNGGYFRGHCRPVQNQGERNRPGAHPLGGTRLIFSILFYGFICAPISSAPRWSMRD